MNFPVGLKTNCVNYLMKTRSPWKLKELISNVSLVNSRIQMNWMEHLTHWSINVGKCLIENLLGRWIGRGGQQDCNITPRYPDITPLYYFIW